MLFSPQYSNFKRNTPNYNSDPNFLSYFKKTAADQEAFKAQIAALEATITRSAADVAARKVVQDAQDVAAKHAAAENGAEAEVRKAHVASLEAAEKKAAADAVSYRLCRTAPM